MWDHIPTDVELLDMRIAQGWQPTASSLNEGDIILGYAACRNWQEKGSDPQV